MQLAALEKPHENARDYAEALPFLTLIVLFVASLRSPRPISSRRRTYRAWFGKRR